MQTNHHALAEDIRKAAHAYYNNQEPHLTDAEYDAGIEQLRIVVQEDPTLREDFKDLLEEVAAGQAAGGDVKHERRMGSLDKVFGLDAVEEFVNRVPGDVVVEPKLDGLAVRLHYRNGELTLAATRGDGNTGENITETVRTLVPVGGPLRIGITEEFDMTGELYVSDEGFRQANEIRATEGGAPFANPRNTAAGIIRRGSASYKGVLSFAAYEADLSEDEHASRMKTLRENGVLTARELMENHTGDTTMDSVKQLGDSRDTIGYPIDGAVLKAASQKVRDQMGETSKTPRWAMAYKYEAAEAETRVVGITTDVGRTGRLSIRVQVEPVFVGGTTITYATGHNPSWMVERDIRVGDTVTIKRAGDVIPYISSVNLDKRTEDSEAWTPPEKDPMGNPWDKSSLLWRSTSPELSVLGKLVYATSRDALDIEGIGEEVSTGLVDAGLVTNLPDLFNVTEAQLTDLELKEGRKLGAKNTAKIMRELGDAKELPWHRVITALGIRGTGTSMSRRIGKVLTNLGALRNATVADLEAIEGIGKKKAELILEGIQELDTAGVLDELENTGLALEGETVASAGGALAGETVVVTGKIPGLGRTQVKERVEELGGSSSSSVTSSTTLLVAEEGSTSSKVKKAEQLGIRTITPEDFLDLQ